MKAEVHFGTASEEMVTDSVLLVSIHLVQKNQLLIMGEGSLIYGTLDADL